MLFVKFKDPRLQRKPRKTGYVAGMGAQVTEVQVKVQAQVIEVQVMNGKKQVQVQAHQVYRWARKEQLQTEDGLRDGSDDERSTATGRGCSVQGWA